MNGPFVGQKLTKKGKTECQENSTGNTKTGQMHMKTWKPQLVQMLAKWSCMHHPVLFKVANVLKVTCCVKDRSYYISLSNDIALTSTLSITDVELKLKNAAQCSNEKSSMCLTDAVFFGWWNSICWMWSMEEVKKVTERQNFTVLSCVCK